MYVTYSNERQNIATVEKKNNSNFFLCFFLSFFPYSISFGILGKPLEQFSRSTLIACEEQKDDSDADREPENQTDDNNEDPGILVKSNKSSFIRPTSSDVVKYGSNTYTSVRNSAATIEAVTSDTD